MVRIHQSGSIPLIEWSLKKQYLALAHVPSYPKNKQKQIFDKCNIILFHKYFLGIESQWGKGQWHDHDLPTSKDELKNMLSDVKEGFSSVGTSLCCGRYLPTPDSDRVNVSENLGETAVTPVSCMVPLIEANQVDEVQVSDETGKRSKNPPPLPPKLISQLNKK